MILGEIGPLGLHEGLSLLEILGNEYSPSEIPLYLKLNSLKLLHISSRLLSVEAL